MRLLKFLKYERPYMCLYLICFFLFGAVFYVDPKINWQWNTFFYGLFLNLLIFIAFFLYRYYQTIGASKHIQHEDHEPLSFEGYYYEKHMEQLKRIHIKSLNEVQEKQHEYHDFIVSWFHEIKTPISILRLMEQTEVDFQSLQEELTRIEHYVEQALYYAKLDDFNQDYEVKNCNLEKLIKDVVKSHSKTFISKKIKIKLALFPTNIQSDSKWLQFIINQMMTNALKYVESGGEISISIKEEPQEKQLVITDNGVGIEAKDLSRIFQRGFTGTNGRLYAKSTGMGLYLAQELSNKLGHYITCDSKVNTYTTFIIHFPKNKDSYLSIVNKKN